MGLPAQNRTKQVRAGRGLQDDLIQPSCLTDAAEPERWCVLPKITWLVGGRARMRVQELPFTECLLGVSHWNSSAHMIFSNTNSGDYYLPSGDEEAEAWGS